MKQQTFQKILNIWKENEGRSIQAMPLDKTAACLSFAQFEAGVFSVEQQQHIKQCTYCSRMSRLFTKYEELTEEIVTEYAETAEAVKQKHSPARILEKVKNKLDNFITGLGRLVQPIPVPLRVAIPIMIMAIILFLSIPTTQKKYADLARIEPLYYQPIETRGKESLPETERLFQHGMTFYQQKDYGSAINKLLSVIKSQPEDINANFYVGLCYLLTKKADRAIFFMQKVIELKGEFLFEKCYWYLGNAYLLKNDGKKALEMFEKVVTMEGNFEWEAREMIGKIAKMKK